MSPGRLLQRATESFSTWPAERPDAEGEQQAQPEHDDEWPSENQKPTDTGRLPSAMSLRVVLSIAAMWSASKACRMPSV